MTIHFGDSTSIDSGGSIGKFLQVQSVTKTNTFITSSSSFVDITGLSLNITPSSSSSKILVLASITMANTNTGQRFVYALRRDSTDIAIADADGNRVRGTGGGQDGGGGTVDSCAAMHLDSPNTTSAVTYVPRVAALDSGSIIINRSNSDADSATYARFASFLTLIEVFA